MAITNGKLLNYVANEWREFSATEYLPVINPATMDTLGQVPLSPAVEVEQAAQAATEAFVEWQPVPVVDRVQ